VRKALNAVLSAVGARKSVFAIGDVHGCDEELRALIQKLPLNRDSLVVFLGDYIDRGPNSRGVVDTILELKQYCRVICLLGNHELMLREFLDGSDARRMARFIYNGGGATLASYSDDDGVFSIPEEHLAFYEELAHYHVEGEHCFVHAGLPVDVEELDMELHGEDLVWMRLRPGVPEPTYSKIVVHGHTPRPQVEILPHRINLDTSCVYGHSLTAMELHSHRMWNVERSTTPQPIYLRDVRDSRRAALRFQGRVPVSVQYQGRTLAFETTNYSELGILMHHVEQHPPHALDRGATITGLIGEGTAATPFKGVVLRVDAGRQYAVKLIVEAPTL
jgi:serine/threonine protein phosphatase 1